MIQIYVDDGLVPILLRVADPSLRYHLFNNNHTVTRNTVLADLTEESTFGYADVLVVLADFVASGVTAHVGSVLAAPISFTPAGGAWTLYGFYVTDSASAILLWAANFDAPPITRADGVPLLLTPKIGDFSNGGA